jgi:hypothetical protein
MSHAVEQFVMLFSRSEWLCRRVGFGLGHPGHLFCHPGLDPGSSFGSGLNWSLR